MKKPAQLKKGDSIAIISPSWGGPSVYPHIYEAGITNLRALGFKPIELASTRMDPEKLYHNPQIRAEDVNQAFADPTIQGLIASIGGDDSVRILKYLDLQQIQASPKLLMGYSDLTTLTTYLNQHEMVTFNGPSLMAGFAQLHKFSSTYQDYLEAYLFTTNGSFDLPVFNSYTEGYAPWEDLTKIGEINPLNSNDGLHFIQGTGQSSGQLFGGCFEILEMMKGTEFWPRPEFWQNKILFLESSENKPSIELVSYWLRNYGVMGLYEKLSGLLIGRPRDYSASEKAALESAILKIVRDEFGCSELPIVCNLDFGHTDPQLILPLGIKFEINVSEKKLTQLESAFATTGDNTN